MKKIMKIFLIILCLLQFINISIFSESQKVKVSINSIPEGANVYPKDNHNSIGVTPFIQQFTVNGKYELIFKKHGFKTKIITYVCDGSPINVILEKEHNQNNQQNEFNLTINSNVLNAAVYINDIKYGSAPYSIKLKRGEYKIRVSYQGYIDYHTKLFLDSDQIVYANLEASLYNLTVNSNIDQAEVYINGNKAGNTPYSAMMPAGAYSVKVKYPGAQDYEQTVNLNSDQTVFANFTLTFTIFIVLPKDATVYINGDKKKTEFKEKDKDDWKIFKFTSNQEVNEIRIRYHKVSVKKNIKFDGSKITVFLDIKPVEN